MIETARFWANGEELTDPVADYGTLEELKAAHVPAGRYAISTAAGAIKFGDGPLGNASKRKGAEDDQMRLEI